MTTKTYTPDTGSNGQGDAALAAPPAPGLERRGPGGPVAHEMRSFVADVEDLVTATTSLTGDDLARAKARLAERLDAAKQTLARTGTALAQGARRGAAATDQYVQASPWRAVGISAATGAIVGLLLGFLLARRA